MTSEEFCVVCGATDRALTDGVCAECAADRSTLASIPKRVEVVICPTCGARLVAGAWVRQGATDVLTAEDLTPLVQVPDEVGVRRVEWEEQGHTPTIREYVGRAHVKFRGVERTVALPTSVRVDRRTCLDCSHRSGRYFTATIQLRGPESRPEKTRALQARLGRTWDDLLDEARPDWRRAVSWREPLPEGWDVFFTDTLAARAVARLAKQKFGASLKESATLFGRKNGQDVYRVTFCLRFPLPVGPGRPVSAHLEQ